MFCKTQPLIKEYEFGSYTFCDSEQKEIYYETSSLEKEIICLKKTDVKELNAYDLQKKIFSLSQKKKACFRFIESFPMEDQVCYPIYSIK